jgi:hypothetical protein
MKGRCQCRDVFAAIVDKTRTVGCVLGIPTNDIGIVGVEARKQGKRCPAKSQDQD